MSPLVLLHGFMGGPSSWASFTAALRYPGPVIAPQLFGHGSPPRPVPSDFWGAVDTLAERLAEPAFVIGYSLGGRLALGLARRHPQNLRGVVAIGAHPGLSPEERAPRLAWEEELAARLENEGLAAFVDVWEKLPLFASQARLPGALRAEQRALRLSHEPRALAHVLRNLGTGRMPSLGPARAPVLRVSGQEDPAAHAADRTIPGVGHNPLLEAPDVLVRIVKDQLGAWAEIRTLENHA